jgi:hypothetical protein
VKYPPGAESSEFSGCGSALGEASGILSLGVRIRDPLGPAVELSAVSESLERALQCHQSEDFDFPSTKAASAAFMSLLRWFSSFARSCSLKLAQELEVRAFLDASTLPVQDVT